MQSSYPILLYHHVSPDREITPEVLEAQLHFLANEGYQAVALADLLEHMAGRRALPDRGFVVTFDDGYADNWLHAFPVLEKLKIPTTIYLVTDRITDAKDPRPFHQAIDTVHQEREAAGFLSWSEVRRMAESGLVSFGSHTCSHREFKRRTPYKNLVEELRDSKQAVESHAGIPCLDLAWPWGDYEDDWLPQVQAAGYRSAASTLAGANTRGSNPLVLRRLSIRHAGTGGLSSRMLWSRHAWSAALVGPVYGLDRRLKRWLQKESPYAHG